MRHNHIAIIDTPALGVCVSVMHCLHHILPPLKCSSFKPALNRMEVPLCILKSALGLLQLDEARVRVKITRELYRSTDDNPGQHGPHESHLAVSDKQADYYW